MNFPSRRKHRRKHVFFFYSHVFLLLGYLNKASSCFSKSQFTEACVEQLTLDPDGDKVASHAELANFLGETLPCILSTSTSSTPTTEAHNDACSTPDASQNPPSFFALPFMVQYRFVSMVCYELNGKKTSTDCMRNVNEENLTKRNFGFILDQEDTSLPQPRSIEVFCSDIYADLVDSGYVPRCIASKLFLTDTPSATPTRKPLTFRPSSPATNSPTQEPTYSPSSSPTSEPSSTPTAVPTSEPSATPTAVPTSEPSATPTAVPTTGPSTAPFPSISPSATPTLFATEFGRSPPSTISPSSSPSLESTIASVFTVSDPIDMDVLFRDITNRRKPTRRRLPWNNPVFFLLTGVILAIFVVASTALMALFVSLRRKVGEDSVGTQNVGPTDLSSDASVGGLEMYESADEFV